MKDFTKENGWVHDMVMACRQDPNSADINGVALYHIIELIRQDEREACAKIAMKYEPIERHPDVTYAADEIRARGNT